jgi:diguanylate cyclase (GGDEF)-like protein
MPYGRSKLYDQGDIAEHGDVAAAPVSPRSSIRTVRDARRELDTLRSINAHLVREVAILKQREAQAQRLADRDGLTGLYNRRRMLELLDTALGDAAGEHQRVGLLFVDLDGFKRINDEYGHAVGDKLLITVASRLAARARIGDFVCRYGGDEFVVILPHVANMSAVLHVAGTIRKRVALPYRIDGAEFQVSAAIGVAMYPDEARNAAALLHVADESMYRAKLRATRPMLPAASPMRRRDDKFKRRFI